jgi:DNA-binding MarR family transcriptional regulator
MLSTSHFPAQSRVQNLVVGLQKIGLVMRHHQGTETGPDKVNPLEMQTLQLLFARHDQTIAISTIATELGVTDDTALMVVRQLASKRLVLTSLREDDEAFKQVRLSLTGRCQAEIAIGWPDVLTGTVDRLSPAEQSDLLSRLIHMIRLLQEAGDIPIARMCVTCRYFRPGVHADPERPHHCDYVDAAFGSRDLRLDCHEHEPAEPQRVMENWVVVSRLSP